MREIGRIERAVHNLDWIDDKGLRAAPSDLNALLARFSSEEMTCWPVSARVNVKNNDPV